MSILLVLEYPLGSNDIVFPRWPWHQSPHLVVLEVVEFFMHGIEPIRVFERLIDLLGFNTRDKRVMFTIVCQLSTSAYPLLNASKYILHEMTLGGELGCNLGGTTLQFLLGGELRSGHLIILSDVLSLFLILNLLGGENLTLGITWCVNTVLSMILP